MKIIVHQKKGTLQGKQEMEDRVVIGTNILSDGFHIFDHFCNGIFAVLDGVGGLAGSAYASTCVARALSDITIPSNPETIRNTLSSIHNTLIKTSSTATTLTAVHIQDEEATLFHIGNCRLYGLFNGYIRQITTDQTQYESMLQQGFLEKDIPESAKCVITACLGAKSEMINHLIVENINTQISNCPKLLLSSDGIHDHISIDDLEAFLQKDITIESLERLFELARQSGSEDDMSLVVIER